ncbi:TVP38/TMEM64 family protein [Gemella morbillorum]|mgnify:FL=1|uniref:TVP38/TMEM64 family protein n=1 Tax=Gemella morbillorum TaxID=29391 RepID=UPI00248E7A80|nr:VTT domain-containing protein [Gemella morbillorum]
MKIHNTVKGEDMQNFIEQFGDYAPIIFLLLASILPIFLFPPGIFSVIGGLLFGFTKGAILTIIAAIIYTNIMFLLSRYFARNKIENFLEKRLTLKQFNRIFGLKDNKLATFLIICRLIPILPNSIVSYSYGLTRISFKHYFIANLIGLIPGRLIWLNFGSKLNNIWSLEFLTAAILILAFVIIGAIVAKNME